MELGIYQNLEKDNVEEKNNHNPGLVCHIKNHFRCFLKF